MSTASTIPAAISTKSWSLPTWLVRPFALDVRGLAAMRIGMAMILLWDIAFRTRDLTAH